MIVRIQWQLVILIAVINDLNLPLVILVGPPRLLHVHFDAIMYLKFS